MYDIPQPKDRPLWFIRKSYLPYLKTLEPKTDHCQIVHITTGLEFPWDMVRALEVALLRTFASRSISGLLKRTGKFEKQGQRRYDDTALLIAEFMKWGYEHPRGKEAIERMNFIHSHYPIKNEDYVFVLSTFVLDPIKWMDQFGWRPLHEVEKQGLFYFFIEIGKRMQLHDLPATLDQMQAQAQAYEAKYFSYAPENEKIALATIAVMEAWMPPFVRFAIKPSVTAMLDKPLRRAFGLTDPPPWLAPVLRAGLKVRARTLRWINPNRTATFATDQHNRTYPKGYEIQELGPEHLSGK